MSVATEIKKIIKRFGLEYFNRFYGIYRGTVADNDDPDKRGRLKLIIPAVAGKEILDYWSESAGIYAGKNYGIVNIPKIGETVWVHFENGNAQYPIWMHGYFKKNVEDTNNYPERKLLYFSSGQKVFIDPKDKKIEIDNAGVKILIDNYGISLVRKSKKVSLGGSGGSEFSAVKGETLETTLSNIITQIELLNGEVIKILPSFVPLPPAAAQTIPAIAGVLASIAAQLAAVKSTVPNIKSNNVNLDG